MSTNPKLVSLSFLATLLQVNTMVVHYSSALSQQHCDTQDPVMLSDTWFTEMVFLTTVLCFVLNGGLSISFWTKPGSNQSHRVCWCVSWNWRKHIIVLVPISPPPTPHLWEFLNDISILKSPNRLSYGITYVVHSFLMSYSLSFYQFLSEESPCSVWFLLALL